MTTPVLNSPAAEILGRPAIDDDRAVMRDFLTPIAGNPPGLTKPESTIEAWTAWLRVLLEPMNCFTSIDRAGLLAGPRAPLGRQTRETTAFRET